VFESGYQYIIFTDLVDDPLLTVNNMRYFQKISKDMYQYTVVRHVTPLPLYFVVLLVLIVPLIQDLAKHSQQKSEKLKAVVSGLQELNAKDKRISELQEQLKEQKKAHQGKPFLPSNTFT
jgi:hypothetical protein